MTICSAKSLVPNTNPGLLMLLVYEEYDNSVIAWLLGRQEKSDHFNSETVLLLATTSLSCPQTFPPISSIIAQLESLEASFFLSAI